MTDARFASALVEAIPRLWIEAASGAVCVGLAGCREVLLRVARDGRVGGGVTPVISALTNLCLDDLMAGRWAEAQRLADEGLELVHTTGYRLVAWVFQHRKAVLAAARGSPGTAQVLADEITRWAAPRRADMAEAHAQHVRVPSIRSYPGAPRKTTAIR